MSTVQPTALAIAVLCFSALPLAQRVAQDQPRGGNASPTRTQEEQSRPLMTNVQVGVTITDSMGAAAPVRKSVSMVTADGRMGRIRSAREGSQAVLNVDATPTIYDDQIRLQLSLEYSPPFSGDSSTRLSHVSEIVTLMVQPGKPTLVTQAADPAVDRKVTVEVTATIVK